MSIETKVAEIAKLKNEYIALGNKYRSEVKEVIRKYLVENSKEIRQAMPEGMTVELSFSVQYDDEGYRVFNSQLLMEERNAEGEGSVEIYKTLTPHNLNYPLNPERDGYVSNASSELMAFCEQYIELLNQFNQFLDELDVVGDDSLLEPETRIVVR